MLLHLAIMQVRTLTRLDWLYLILVICVIWDACSHVSDTYAQALNPNWHAFLKYGTTH